MATAKDCAQIEKAMLRAGPEGFWYEFLLEQFTNNCLQEDDMASGFGMRTPAIISAPVGQGASRRASKLNAHGLKLGGGGSGMTGPRQSKVGDLGATLGGAAGRHFGGETGEGIGQTLGGLIGDLISGGGRDRPSTPPGFTGGDAGVQRCGEGKIPFMGGCVSPGDAFPGGAPLMVPAGGVAVQGAFGLPAMRPALIQRTVRKCGPGMVLGKDNLCYPKQVLGPRSKYRKHRRPPRPPISSADVRAIRRAARAKDRVADLGRDVGLHVSKSRPKSKAAIKREAKMELLTSGTAGVQITKVD